jgi:hypothetical protein
VSDAYDDAGPDRTIERETPVGRYSHDKPRNDGSKTGVQVKVFLLKVMRQLQARPERAERETQWYDPEEAAELVKELELAIIQREVRGLVNATP